MRQSSFLRHLSKMLQKRSFLTKKCSTRLTDIGHFTFSEKRWFLRLLSAWAKESFFDVLKQFKQHFQDFANLLFFEICPKCCKKGVFLPKSAPPAWQILDILLLMKKLVFKSSFIFTGSKQFWCSQTISSSFFLEFASILFPFLLSQKAHFYSSWKNSWKPDFSSKVKCPISAKRVEYILTTKPFLLLWKIQRSSIVKTSRGS